MTDDEIDAALRPSLAIQWACDEDMVRVPNSARIAYRVGMLRAAEIARDEARRAVLIEQAATLDGGER